jgi:L-rhamnose mutarotase
VLQTITDCGIRNYSIFLRTGVISAYFEYHWTDDDADMRKMPADEATQRWWKIMDPIQSPREDAVLREGGRPCAKCSTSMAPKWI